MRMRYAVLGLAGLGHSLISADREWSRVEDVLALRLVLPPATLTGHTIHRSCTTEECGMRQWACDDEASDDGHSRPSTATVKSSTVVYETRRDGR